MQNDLDDNQLDDEENELYDYKFNFINCPWDDRTSNSKVGIVLLLSGMFVAIAACLANSFALHYYNAASFRASTVSKNECKSYDRINYEYVVTIHSVLSKELLCIGAVLNMRTVVCSAVCTKLGPVFIRVGNKMNRTECDKDFGIKSVEIIEYITRQDSGIVLLITNEHLSECSTEIEIGKMLSPNIKGYVIGKSNQQNLLVHQVTVIGEGNLCENDSKSFSFNNFICVRDSSRCPILNDNLLIIGDKIYGVNSGDFKQKTNLTRLVSYLSLKFQASNIHKQSYH